MPTTARLFTLLAAFASVGLLGCSARRQEVYNCEEFAQAVNDTTVDHVILKQAGFFNCTEEIIPPGSIVVSNRTQTWEGEGEEPVYIDTNQGSETQIVFTNGAVLNNLNLKMEDSMRQATVVGFSSCVGATCYFENNQWSDATCTDVKKSWPINALLNTMRLLLAFKGGLDYEYVDERTVFIRQTEWMRTTLNPPNYWRNVNLTLQCTGNLTHFLPDGRNITHFLPYDPTLVEVERMSHMHRLMAVVGVLAILVVAGVSTWYARKGRNSKLPEYQVAKAKGIHLSGLLGAGHFGRVYKGRDESTGQIVAVKVVDLLPKQSRQAAAAWKECELLSRLEHNNIVQVLGFHAAQVSRTQSRLVALPVGDTYVVAGMGVAQILDSSSLACTGDLTAKHNQAGSTGGALKTPGSATSFSSDSRSDSGVISIQVQLVMQYCDMGTLEQAIKQGVFLDPDTGKPRMRHILLTALDIARGLEYLHHSDRRLVHRDLTAPNVLLATDTDERGFRALLSDFGISTSVSEGQTHQTSEVKGTISYMSPEIYLHNDVSPALDVYSVAIIMHMMLSGVDPFAGQTPAAIILNKVRPSGKPPLPELEGCPQEIQQLVWDCAHNDRRSRPSAADLARRLEGLLSA